MYEKENMIIRLKKQGNHQELLELILQSLNQEELLRELRKYQTHQQQLFDEACHQIDCIDYLIFALEKSLKRK